MSAALVCLGFVALYCIGMFAVFYTIAVAVVGVASIGSGK